ncbi:uncharacterized protein [Drosophila bipectinata]|uniref:uncharacterized protein n=1 Tax=Drosophila bipectinata TaxID=42026 RepID=UPI0038B253B8
MSYSVAPHRANLLLQMLLQANVYVSLVWAMSFLIHLVIRVNQLWNWNGLSLLVAYLLAVSAEFMRLYAGYSVNLCTGATAMWLLLTVTPCILLPAMVFLRLAVAGHALWLRIISNAVFALIALEVVVALVHFVFCKPFRNPKSSPPGFLVYLEKKLNEEEELPEENPPEEQLSPASSGQKRRARQSPESK